MGFHLRNVAEGFRELQGLSDPFLVCYEGFRGSQSQGVSEVFEELQGVSGDLTSFHRNS